MENNIPIEATSRAFKYVKCYEMLLPSGLVALISFKKSADLITAYV